MSRKSPTEESLLKEAVFRQMFESNFTRVVRYIQGQTSNPEVAEDIAADVFKVAWQKLDPNGPFGLPWLIRTAMFKTRDYQRHQYRGAAVTTALQRMLDDDSNRLGTLDRLALYDAMRGLSEKDLQIVRLTYWDGLSAGEIAQVMHMREGAVWTRLHRARALMRAALTDGVTAGNRHD